MFDAGRRPIGRLFYWWLAVLAIAVSVLAARKAGAVPQDGPATTTITDTVYLADGSTAQGNLIITWPAFLTASGAAVAGGVKNVSLGTNGALSVGLVPNAGASPAGMYYTVVYQVGPGQERTEYWMVPTTSPANLAAVRTTPGSGVAGQPVSMQYVNSGLATKADDSAVVHLNGAETISGAKTFAAAPNVPAPTSTGQVANKAYVDQSISNVGAGNYLSTAGGTMTGPITLPASPIAPMQAATKQYVDQGSTAKADLVSGVVPAGELGTGAAGSGTCLLGNGTWGACGSGGGPVGVQNGSALVSNGVAQPSVYQTKVIADVADYPQVVADGATDVCSSFQAFIDANPGKRLIVRKAGGPTQGGGAASTVDYYSSCTFHLKYNGTILESNANAMWQGAPVFLFVAGVTGFQIDPSCSGCAIRDIEEVGGGKPAYNANACYSSGNALVYPFTGAADGVLVYGGEPTLERVQANCNPRDGIHIDGTNVVLGGFTGQPDVWEVKGGHGDHNLHDNLYIHGGDSNAGIESRFMAYNAGGWGVEDDANLGNTHIATFTTANGRDAGIAAKATSNISSISCASYTCNVVAANAVAGIQNHIWIAIAGTSNYNGVYYVTGYTDAQHFSFTWAAPSHSAENAGTVGVDGSTHMLANAIRTTADASCASGQAYLYSQSAQFGLDTQAGAAINVAGAGASGALLSTTIVKVWNEYTVQLATNCLTAVGSAEISYAGGISHGPIFSNSGGNPIVWIAPYWEGDQPSAKMGAGNNVFGGNLPLDYTFGSPTTMSGYGLSTTNFIQKSPSDTQDGNFVYLCGTTSNRACTFWLENYNGSEEWSIGNPFSTNQFQIMDHSTGTGGGVSVFQSVHGGDTSIQATGNINFFGTSIGVTQPHIINGGGFYQASQTAPALTLNTTGPHYEDIYSCGANCLAIGGSTTTTGIPASAIAQFSESLGLTMSLPITLPGNPTSALQAAPKQYVDAALAAKADLMSGTIPASELGTGTAGASTCLLGNGTWGACSGTGSMVYPEAGIASSNGSAWGASLAAPSSTIMGVSDTQTVSNKDFTSLTNVFSGIAGRTVTAGGTDSITSTDANRFVIYNDGATNVTATVADAGGSGLNHYPTIPVVNQGTGTITLNRTSASTINGLATVQISAQSSCTLSSIDNANWLLRCAPLLNAAGQISAAAMLYPTVGVPNSTGAGWGTSYGVGTAAGNLLALDSNANLTLPGNLTVNGQLSVTGPWLIGSAPATSAMTAAGAGSSSLGISNDGNFYISANSGTPAQIVTQAQASSTTPSMNGTAAVGTATSWARADHVHPSDSTKAPLASPVFTGTPVVPGYVPTSTTVNGHALTGNVTVSATDVTTGTLAHAQLPVLVSGDIPNNAANTSGTAANLSGTPALPNGTTAITRGTGDNSTNLATTAYVKNEIYLVWSCSPAGFTTIGNYCSWTLPAAITITGFDYSNVAAISCTTYPVIDVWDATLGAIVGSYALTLTGTGSTWNMTGSANVPSGHVLRFRTATAAVGCTSAGLGASITYQMQN